MTITPELVSAIAAAVVAIIVAIRQGRMATQSSDNHSQTQAKVDDVGRLVEEAIRAAIQARGAAEVTHQVVSDAVAKENQK